MSNLAKILSWFSQSPHGDVVEPQATSGKSEADSIEFYVPQFGMTVDPYIAAGDIAGIHHIARYLWALEVVPKQGTLLDIACGAGYGTALLAKQHPDLECLGVDYDKRAIEYARRHYSAPNLRYECGDLVRWTFENGTPLGQYDCITSFDTVEHLLHREVAFSNLAENLRPDGTFLMSTPCGHEQPLLNPAWEHHKMEYSSKLLHDFTRRFFGKVCTPDEGTLPNLDYWTRLNTPKNLYLNRMNPLACYKPIQFGR